MSKEEIRKRYMIQLKGKDYLPVAGRILMFREDYPVDDHRGAILTDILNADEVAVTYKATIIIDGCIVATGHGTATKARSENFGGRVFEKAETAAIGRALLHAGYGTDAAGDDLDETSETDSPAHYADSGAPARDEKPAQPKNEIPKNDGKVLLKNTKAITAFYEECRARGISTQEAGKRLAGRDLAKMSHQEALAIVFGEVATN